MRRWDTKVTYHHKGTKYEKSHTAIVESSGPEAAAGRAIRECRRKNGGDFRVVPGFPIYVRVTPMADITKGGTE